MPSILETDDVSPAGPKPFKAEVIPHEITTDSPSKKMNRRPSRDDDADPGVFPGFEATAGLDSMGLISSRDSISSSGSGDNHSISLESLTLRSDGSDNMKPLESPRQAFNESEATRLVSNTNKSPALQKAELKQKFDLGTVTSNSISGESSDLDSSDHTTRSSNLVAQHSDSVSSLGTGGHSRNEIQTSFSGSTGNASGVSQASSIPTRRLPIGVDVSPPVEGLETDDLNAIFAAAARRMSK